MWDMAALRGACVKQQRELYSPVVVASSCIVECCSDRFGRSAAEAEAYLRGFETSYFLQRLDVEGDDVRLLRAFPSLWQVHG